MVLGCQQLDAEATVKALNTEALRPARRHPASGKLVSDCMACSEEPGDD